MLLLCPILYLYLKGVEDFSGPIFQNRELLPFLVMFEKIEFVSGKDSSPSSCIY